MVAHLPADIYAVVGGKMDRRFLTPGRWTEANFIASWIGLDVSQRRLVKRVTLPGLARLTNRCGPAPPRLAFIFCPLRISQPHSTIPTPENISNATSTGYFLRDWTYGITWRENKGITSLQSRKVIRHQSINLSRNRTSVSLALLGKYYETWSTAGGATPAIDTWHFRSKSWFIIPYVFLSVDHMLFVGVGPRLRPPVKIMFFDVVGLTRVSHHIRPVD